MIATFGRRLDVLGVGPLTALGLAGVLVAALVVGVGVTAQLGVLPLAVFAAAGLVAFALSLRWPLAALLLLTVLIPIEEVGTISGFGTLSRLAGVLFAVAYAVPRLGSLRLSVMPIFGWAYLAWALLSSAWALSPATSWAELPTLLQLFLVGLLVADFVTRRPEIVRQVLMAYSLSASATAVLGILSFLGGGSVEERGAALAGQNPAQFAAVLLPAFAFGFHEAVLGRRRVLGAVIALLTLLAIVVSGTRGAWVALVVVPILVLPRLSAKRLAIAGIGMALLVVVALQVPGVGAFVSERTGNAISTGGAGRTDIWSVAGVIYRSAPVLGVGYANFPVAFTPAVILEATVQGYVYAGRAPHDLIVASLVELGPLGLTLAALFLVPLALRRGWGEEATAVRAAMASLLTVALFLDVVGNRKQVWLVIGLAAGLWWLRKRAEEAGPQPVAEAPEAPDRPLLPLATMTADQRRLATSGPLAADESLFGPLPEALLGTPPVAAEAPARRSPKTPRRRRQPAGPTLGLDGPATDADAPRT